jgi:hypothetical protein
MGAWDVLFEKIAMIVKTPEGYQVRSEKGKNLSKPNLTKEEAERRLKQVEYFKNKKVVDS